MGSVCYSYYLFFFDIVRFMEPDVNFNNMIIPLAPQKLLF